MLLEGFIAAARVARVGGPLGSLLARAARYLPDRLFGRARPSPGRSAAADSVTFTIAVIALGAKMAKADGTVTRDEVAAFREVFRVPPGEEQHLRLVFDIARRSTAGFQSYARQVARLFVGETEVLEDLLRGLFHIALADGVLCAAEQAYLREVARLIGLDAAAYLRVRGEFVEEPAKASDDAHDALGLPAGASEAEIRAAHRRLLRTHHPDLAQAGGSSPERIALANARLARINAARDRLLKRRSLGSATPRTA